MTVLPKSFDILQRYNGLDCCATLEIRNILLSQMDDISRETYEEGLELLGPAFKMMSRGVLINKNRLNEEKSRLQRECEKLDQIWQNFTAKLLGTPGNIRSTHQLKILFYEILNYPTQFKFTKGIKSISTDRAALEKLSQEDEFTKFMCSILLEYRDRAKTLEVLKVGLEPNGRIRTSFNPFGTVTWRWSSSENPFHRGTNLQNITEDLRSLFISDPGYKFFNIDYEQVDSRNVALEVFQTTGDDSYLKACESGDLHTQVAKMTWPELPWTGDPKKDKLLAETPFYRHYSYRFMCKKLGHGSNYLGKPKTLAKQAKIDLRVCEAFQERYFEAFPGIPLWQQIRIEELQLERRLTTIMNRRRQFHGRVSDESTWREAIAFLGQSPTASLINKAVLRIDKEVPEAQLLLQVHDSLLGQIREEQFDELFPKVLACFDNPITVTHSSGQSRTHVIPSDGACGWNWGKRWAETPDGKLIEVQRDGLQKWRGAGSDDRKSRYYNPAASLLDRRLR